MLTFARKKLLWGAVIAFFTAILVNAGFYSGAFEEVELKTFDLRLRYFNQHKKPPSDVAIILVDEASLRAMNPVVGRWPWPRSIHADLVDFLALSGAKAVLFDILFTENERVPGSSSKSGPNDLRLAEATGAAGMVYHAAQILVDTEDEYNKGMLRAPLPSDFIMRFSLKGFMDGESEANNNYYIPFPELYNASKGIGVVEFSSDRDGIFRRTKLIRNYQGSYYPVFSMAPLLDIINPASIKQEEDRLVLSIEGVAPSDVSIPLQKDDSYLINMYGDFKPFSMSGILASIQKIKVGELEELPVSPEEFKDKVVFVGGSAVGIEDLKPTSMGNKTPGVYLHASIYGNVVNEDFLTYRKPSVTTISIFALSFAAAFAIVWSRRTIYQIGIPFFLMFTYMLASLWWFKNNFILDMVAPVSSIILSWMGTFAFLSFTEGKDKRKMKKMLGQYVSPTILATIIDRKQDVLKAEVGSKETLTILFSDIRGFTTISESLDAGKVVEVLNGYLSEMVDVIFKHEGTLDKFIGDAIMAFWGAPIKAGDHGKKAVEAAMEMIQRLKAFNEVIREKGLPAIAIGVGINTGEVILGNIGSEKKLDYTIIGDNVNLASRMEGLTKEYGCPILITETTYEELRDAILCRVVDTVRVKGKKRGIKIFEPLSMVEGRLELTEKIVSLSEEGFSYYLNREWEKARGSYSMLLSLKRGDKVGGIFIQRCDDYIESEPPEDWDGVYTMLKK